nr:hypothetical protein [Phytohabitans rumicis]
MYAASIARYSREKPTTENTTSPGARCETASAVRSWPNTSHG